MTTSRDEIGLIMAEEINRAFWHHHYRQDLRQRPVKQKPPENTTSCGRCYWIGVVSQVDTHECKTELDRFNDWIGCINDRIRPWALGSLARYRVAKWWPLTLETR